MPLARKLSASHDGSERDPPDRDGQPFGRANARIRRRRPPGGSPVVAHHGTPGSRLFAAMLSGAAVAEGVRLIVPDRPGYGRSSPPPDGWTLRDWRDDLATLLRSESVDRAGIFGFSGGGPFAMAAADNHRVDRLGLASTVVPPADSGFARLSTVPFALRVLFRVFGTVASVTGPETVVERYTDRTVPGAVSRAVADDFHESLRQGAAAIERENRLFATESVDPASLSLPVRAWHGTRDRNTPPSPVRRFVRDSGGTVTTAGTDHLGTLLDSRRDVLRWLTPE